MAYTGQISRRQRVVSGGGALFAVVAVGFGLASGLDLDVVRKASQAIAAVAIPAPPPPEPVVPQAAPSYTASGKASAANKHAKAAPIVAPKAKLPPTIPPITAAPFPGAGNDSAAGAAPNPGTGSGAGGRGDGDGAGGSGSGTGGGSKAVWKSGTIRDRDYPAAASRARIGGEVEVRFTIQPTGRVTGCRVTRSSGDATLDVTTCRLIEERFRFRPATNAAGDAVASAYGWRQNWWLEPRR
ncbi:MAG: TonB family protein [Sphingopyxis sp.]|nr:TonB family protein [Sphingopyxis sp.]